MLRRLTSAYARPVERSCQVARPYAVRCSSISAWSDENTGAAAGSVTSFSGPPGCEGSTRYTRRRSLPRSLTTAKSARPAGVRSPDTRSTLLNRPGAWSSVTGAGAGIVWTREASSPYTRSPPSLAVATTRLRPGSASLRQIAGSSAFALPPASSSYSAAVSAVAPTDGSDVAWAGERGARATSAVPRTAVATSRGERERCMRTDASCRERDMSMTRQEVSGGGALPRCRVHEGDMGAG